MVKLFGFAQPRDFNPISGTVQALRCQTILEEYERRCGILQGTLQVLYEDPNDSYILAAVQNADDVEKIFKNTPFRYSNGQNDN